MPHYGLRKVADHMQRWNPSRKKYENVTAEAIFYAGESCQRPDLKLQQWGNAKDDVRNA